MKQLGIKVWNWIKYVSKHIIQNFREIFTTIVEIVSAGVIAYGVSINWGKGWGFIVGGILAIVLSFLSSFEPNPERGNQ